MDDKVTNEELRACIKYGEPEIKAIAAQQLLKRLENDFRKDAAGKTFRNDTLYNSNQFIEAMNIQGMPREWQLKYFEKMVALNVEVCTASSIYTGSMAFPIYAADLGISVTELRKTRERDLTPFRKFLKTTDNNMRQQIRDSLYSGKVAILANHLAHNHWNVDGFQRLLAFTGAEMPKKVVKTAREEFWKLIGSAKLSVEQLKEIRKDCPKSMNAKMQRLIREGIAALEGRIRGHATGNETDGLARMWKLSNRNPVLAGLGQMHVHKRQPPKIAL